MKREIKLGLLAVAFTALMTGLALPSLARAEIKVTVLAAEYDNTQLVAAVVAYATAGEVSEDWDVELFVCNSVCGGPVGTVVEELTFTGAKLWKIVVTNLLGVVDTGNTLKAVVHLATGTAEDRATCGPGVRRTHITAICR